ncbi:cell division control protein 2 A [Tripterygium wilfordii]|uniref:Cell division control protein 2 A n=1 Tax=Tripterygium wilfordii TaxID=458696 RepID=A0A7J7DMB7_TRIWF|nr:cell division control protein 2 homolog B-like isoform X1 [Tripterygium wilfordii]XP_038702514.1 cell division control protein 2 homolog B-like isoform X1 [Tripterygium wilfordii]XP_038702516.1 cell division control protein 2 homolog B-like isoform X1 [Tripterygium wilfordii]KAF5747505.1 cell division control protein 2 A [Tripterygium wilfordii]
MDYWNPESMLTFKEEYCYGEAFLCYTSTGTKYLLKKHKITDDDELALIQKWKDLGHENLVRILDMKLDGNNMALFAFEYHDVHLDKMRNLSKSMIKDFLFQIISGLQYYHSHGLVHKDLRPQNILVYADLRSVKIANYRLAILTGPLKGNKERDGSYRAPEILYAYPGAHNHPAVDMWAVGCLFAEMVKQKPIFRGANIVERVDSIHRLLGSPEDNLVLHSTLCDFLQRLSVHSPKSLAAEFPDLEATGVDLLTVWVDFGTIFIYKLLCLDPKKRITSADALKHPYFANVGC